ncbi:MAG: DUF3795 domain-containing protein [Proteobacteria bacterium]|nr:DUF3795 domain-containing protein [Pseudomonadota bacterium]
MKDKDLTGYCGLYCGDCIRYNCRASELSSELLREFEKHHFNEYANVKKVHNSAFENFEKLTDLLKAISEINCETPCGSGGDGCGGSCIIISCVHEKQIQGCWECEEFANCEKLNFLKPFHGNSIVENLRRIQKYGISDWAKHREKCYPWV